MKTEMISRRGVLSLAAAGSCAALAGCGGTAGEVGGSASAEAADDVGTTQQVAVVMNATSEPSAGFDPLMSWGCGEHVHEPLIQSTLITTDEDLNIVGDLSTDYFCSADGLVWTFTIRDDVVFSDGEPLTAADVAFTVNGVIVNPASSADLSMVDRAVAVSDTVVELRLSKPYNALRGRGIALVPQRVTYLDPRMRVGEQVCGVARGATRAERAEDHMRRRARQRELFEAYGLGREVERMYSYELSGGMARRVLLMCALMDEPRLIVADEPTPGLDLERAVRALDDLRAFADAGGSVLLITHDLELGLRVADRVAVFKDGTIVEETAAASFVASDALRHPFSRALVASLPERWDGDDVPGMVALGSQTAFEGDVSVLLRATSLRFSYPGARELFDGLSIEVKAGERVALVAPSGAGKTTLCKLLAGYLAPASGAVEVAGAPLDSRMDAGAARPVQLIAQHPEQAFDPRMRMRASLVEAGDADGARARMLRGRFGVRDEWLERLPHELSGGELMRCCMVRALMASPRVLICDESTAMLDLVTQAELWRVLCELQVREGFGIIFTSHVPTLVRRLATRVVEL